MSVSRADSSLRPAPRARALWLVEPGRYRLRGETLAPPAADDVLVRTLYSGVSRGTESLVYRGRVPDSLRHSMRAPFQQGEFPAPVKYGYCSVGVVEQGAPALRGRAVFCLYPHQDRYVVPAHAVAPLPDGLPPRRALLAANAETALNGLWDAAPRLGDRIAVIGAGVVGLLCAYLASAVPGCEVELIDIDDGKTAAARALGVPLRSPGAARAEADLVIHASASEAGLATALRLAGFEATVLELSWYGAGAVAAPLGEAFHAKRLRLCSSQVGSVAAAQRGRWDFRRRRDCALRLLRDDRLDALIGDECDFAELPTQLPRWLDTPGALCQTVRY